ncbi:hypothetical protein COTS27_00963 [Spirochaetota bacterium]|nr:hypothetical protein COTS27_00963 [Spirochaetota bacterium]
MKKKILILVKTYPTLSKKYFELVCTAGIDEQGKWYRLYPIPFRSLNEFEKYKKYQWVNVDLKKNAEDIRPESHKLINHIEILTEVIKTNNKWNQRKIHLSNTECYTSKQEIIDLAHKNKISLCRFKPNTIKDFSYEEIDRNWDEDKIKSIEKESESRKESQYLFDDAGDFRKEIKIVSKLPYKFYYHFTDSYGKESKLMIEDWEIGALYWNCFRKYKDESKALRDVEKKYKDNFLHNKDITLFLGTTREFHIRKAKNPFVIVGVFYPPK